LCAVSQTDKVLPTDILFAGCWAGCDWADHHDPHSDATALAIAMEKERESHLIQSFFWDFAAGCDWADQHDPHSDREGGTLRGHVPHAAAAGPAGNSSSFDRV
jgi:hypothetical protein